MSAPGDLVWHDDGHILYLELNRDQIVVSTVHCPHAESSACSSRRGCVVDWFIRRYGLECHVGVCAPSAELPVAWAIVGDTFDLDAAQVWVISTDDALFAAWAETLRRGDD